MCNGMFYRTGETVCWNGASPFRSFDSCFCSIHDTVTFQSRDFNRFASQLTSEFFSVDLVSVLVDNAVKYSPDSGNITVSLTAHKKDAVLSVCNSTDETVKENDLKHIFERFYRSDASRNSETGGHGIGLSIAKAITDAHGGTISAATKTGYEFIVTANLPL